MPKNNINKEKKTNPHRQNHGYNKQRRYRHHGTSNRNEIKCGILPFRFDYHTGEVQFFTGIPGAPKGYHIGPDSWRRNFGMFKGTLGKKDKSPIECAIREFSEETGISMEWIQAHRDRLIPLNDLLSKPDDGFYGFGLDMTDNERFDTSDFHSNMVYGHHSGQVFPEMTRHRWRTMKEMRRISKRQEKFFLAIEKWVTTK